MNHKLRQILFVTLILLLFTSCASYQIRGRLAYNGTEIDEIAAVQPIFWFRSEDRNAVVTPTIKYNKSYVKIYGLLPGKYGMSVNIDSNPKNPRMYPGDFTSWIQFNITEGQKSDLDIELQKIIHLTSPQDNETVLRYGGAECAEKIAQDSPVVVSWDALEKGANYDYSIEIIQCEPFKILSTIAGGTTQDTSISLQFPHSAPNEFYLLKLMARKNGKLIGQLVTHGMNAYKWEAWDYRFRVN